MAQKKELLPWLAQEVLHRKINSLAGSEKIRVCHRERWEGYFRKNKDTHEQRHRGMKQHSLFKELQIFSMDYLHRRSIKTYVSEVGLW